jgi:hypothetical protein
MYCIVYIVNKYENKEFVELNVSMSINLFKSVELIRKGLMNEIGKNLGSRPIYESNPMGIYESDGHLYESKVFMSPNSKI